MTVIAPLIIMYTNELCLATRNCTPQSWDIQPWIEFLAINVGDKTQPDTVLHLTFLYCMTGSHSFVMGILFLRTMDFLIQLHFWYDCPYHILDMPPSFPMSRRNSRDNKLYYNLYFLTNGSILHHNFEPL